MRLASAVGIGLLFGLGILLSGMGNPAKVMNFFDVFGTWDPSLAFVMGGGILVTAIGYRLVFVRGAPIYGEKFQLPTSTALDMRLLGGSAVFGVGWGLSGFCPGGALPMLASGHAEPIVFVIGLVAGLVGARQLMIRNAQRAAHNNTARA